MKILSLTFLVATTMWLTSCEQKQQQMVGKWQTRGGAAMTYQFEDDGQVKIGEETGTYSFGDSGKLKIRTRSATYLYRLSVSENGDRMTWTDPAGREQVLERVSR